MKAVILVGGLGTRLRPLTSTTPKPMIPLINQPFLEYMLKRLRDQGIDEVILAVQYMADRFREAFGDGSALGLKLHVVEEPEPRGTAGAVKFVEPMLGGPTFVFNGDLMSDLDLRAMYAFHQENHSKVTISLTPVEDPTRFGLVETNADGQITRFLEKPRPEDVTTNMINAGTYIIEPDVFRYVPPNQFYMFERGLFPVLLQTGDKMMGFSENGYWNDIGTPRNYLEAHYDILMGKVNYTMPGEQIANRVWAQGKTTIHPKAQLIGPIVLGEDVVIERGARIVGPTVIGPRCHIGAGTIIEGSILWADNVLDEQVTVRGSMIGNSNHIASHTVLGEGAVVSDHCDIGSENRLERGVRLWPGTTLKEQAISF